MQKEQLIAKLKDKRLRIRLKSLKALTAESKTTDNPVERPEGGNIHYVFRTWYSCFDRTASLAVYYTDKFAMPLTAIVDYASLSAATELIKAEKFANGVYYCGAEVYASYVNNKKLALGALGVPHQHLKDFNNDLAPYRSKHITYTNIVREKINAKFKKFGLALPFDFWSFFGAIKTTSLEDLYVSLASKILQKYQTAEGVINFLQNDLSYALTSEELSKLSDTTNPHCMVDLAVVIFNNLKIGQMMFQTKKNY